MFTKVVYSVLVTVISIIVFVLMAKLMASEGLVRPLFEMVLSRKMEFYFLAISLALPVISVFILNKETTFTQKFELLFIIPVVIPALMAALNVILMDVMVSSGLMTMLEHSLIISAGTAFTVGGLLTFLFVNKVNKQLEAAW